MLEAGRAVRREHEPDLALVGAIRAALDEPRGHGPVDELDRAVVAQQEVVRHVPHRRTVGVTVTAHGQEELVLRGGQPGGPRLLLAPPQEPPQAGPELEQPGVVGVVDASLHGAIVTWATCHGAR